MLAAQPDKFPTYVTRRALAMNRWMTAQRTIKYDLRKQSSLSHGAEVALHAHLRNSPRSLSPSKAYAQAPLVAPSASNWRGDSFVRISSAES